MSVSCEAAEVARDPSEHAEDSDLKESFRAGNLSFLCSEPPIILKRMKVKINFKYVYTLEYIFPRLQI